MTEDKPAAFEHADMAEANRECGLRPGHQYKETCPRCKLPVMLHCRDCRVQVTGCLCSEVERFGNDEAWKRAVQRFGDEAARERMKEAGFWTPEKHD